jgi:cell division protein FtsL
MCPQSARAKREDAGLGAGRMNGGFNSGRRITQYGTWLLGGLFLALTFLSLWQRTQMYRLGYEIEALKQQKSKAIRTHRQLLVEVESLDAVERIEQIAMRQLNMVPALPQQRIYVKRRDE